VTGFDLADQPLDGRTVECDLAVAGLADLAQAVRRWSSPRGTIGTWSGLDSAC
jgi:hypothetical protein